MGIEFFYRRSVTLLLKVNTTLGYRRDNNFFFRHELTFFSYLCHN